MPFLLRGLALAAAAAASVALAAVALEPSDAVMGCASPEHCGAESEDVSLLQLSRVTETPLITRINNAPTAEARLQLLKPLLWVHIAKTGSGILGLLYNHPGICPLATEHAKEEAVLVQEEEFYEKYPQDVVCAGSFNLSYSSVGHLGFGPYFEGNQGHAIAMFRQPEQRVISAYKWAAATNFENNPTLANATVKEYGKAISGCQVKMLAEDKYPDGPGACVADYISPTESMVLLALSRLRNGFGFVGLTDEWALSMCLFHAKFGGECQASEFTNTRPGPKEDGDLYDTSVLEGWVDELDHSVFRLAQSIFQEDLQRFNISHETCHSWCYSKAIASANSTSH